MEVEIDVATAIAENSLKTLDILLGLDRQFKAGKNADPAKTLELLNQLANQ